MNTILLLVLCFFFNFLLWKLYFMVAYRTSKDTADLVDAFLQVIFATSLALNEHYIVAGVWAFAWIATNMNVSFQSGLRHLIENRANRRQKA